MLFCATTGIGRRVGRSATLFVVGEKPVGHVIPTGSVKADCGTYFTFAVVVVFIVSKQLFKMSEHTFALGFRAYINTLVACF